MNSITAVARTELRIALRNRWLAMATLIMLLFALALTFAGSAPTGTLGVDLLTVSVASMTMLSVYLAPLLALMIAFDAIAGESDSGRLALLLTYPISREEILLGKFLAHVGTLGFSIVVGLGAAGVVAALSGGAGAEGLIALFRLIATSILLGATFLLIGYAVSAVSGSATAAAGLAAGVWLIFIVLYDLGLLGAVVMDSGGFFTSKIFPWLMLANPADAFRLWNISASENLAMATGLMGAAKGLPGWAAPLSMFLWPVLAFALVGRLFRRVEA